MVVMTTTTTMRMMSATTTIIIDIIIIIIVVIIILLECVTQAKAFQGTVYSDKATNVRLIKTKTLLMDEYTILNDNSLSLSPHSCGLRVDEVLPWELPADRSQHAPLRVLQRQTLLLRGGHLGRRGLLLHGQADATEGLHHRN